MSAHHRRFEDRRKQAKELLRAVHLGQAEALERVRKHHPKYSGVKAFDAFCLADAQLVIAREDGHGSWPEMLESPRLDPRWYRPSTPYDDVVALVKSARFRADPEATIKREMRLDGDQAYAKDILIVVNDQPWMLEERHADTWDATLAEIYDPPDYTEYLSESD